MRIELTKDGSLARIRAVDWLGTDDFLRFRRATEGVRYGRATKRSYAPIHKLPGLLRARREAGFDAHLDMDLRRCLQEYSVQQWNDLKSVEDRIQRIDQEIYEQTLKQRGAGERLFAYQRFGARWLAMRRTALLADQPGV